MLQNAENAPQQVKVNVFLAKNLVDIGTSAAQLSSEPSDTASLLVKRLFYKPSYMNHSPAFGYVSPGFPYG